MLLKAFRLFVSSTFRDFTQERELLQDKVFPALQAYCAARGYQFHAVDLRWGVNEEAQLDQRTAEICLGEVAAAKGYPAPNLLIMIGDRYGWVPLPFAIAQDEFEAIVAWLTERGETGVVDDLLAAYQLDENAAVERGLVGTKVASEQLIAAYTLRSRDDEISAFAPPDEWEKLEAWLQNALQNAADHLLKLDQIDEAGHQKYFLSLTEQEIIRGIPGYGRRDVRHVADKSRPPHAAGPQAIAWIREPPASPALAPEPRINALKVGLRRILPADCILTDRATAGADGWLDEAYLDRFVTTIESNLKAAIDRHIAHVEAQEHAPDAELQNERAAHRAFAEQRRHIIGREGNVAAIDQYMRGSSTHPLVVYGRSGSGKSALLAHVTTGGASPGSVQHPLVVYRFIGASATSTDQRAMHLSLIDDLAQHGILQKPEAWEDDGNKFVAQVQHLLSAIEKPVVIVLDALDQLRKPYWPNWLPDKLPAVVKIIVSVLDDEAFAADSGIYRSLRPRLPPDAFLEIGPLVAAHGHDILAGLEQAALRRLQPAQRAYVVGQFVKAGGSPLYLRVAFEIARGWRSTEQVGSGGRELAADTTALIAQLIDELTTMHHHEPELVSRTLGYITAARDGLSAAELVDVLSRDAGVMQAISSEQHGARTTRLPVSVWVRLHHHLAALLVEKRVDGQPLLQFFHRQVAEVARERCYIDAKLALHGALASYFDAPTGTNTGSAAPEAGSADYTKRSLAELPYQLFHAERRDRLDEILLAPEWMQQKLNALGPQRLVTDFDDFGRGSMQSLIGRTLRLTTGICARDEHQLLPQLVGRLIGCTDPAAPAFLDQARRMIKRPALLTLRSSLTSPGAETARLQSHKGWVIALAMLPDGRLASASFDMVIRLWDTANGRETICLLGHRGPITALLALPDGRLASASHDKTIRLWDPVSGAELIRLEGHTQSVRALTVLADGQLASGANDKTIRLWDVNTGEETAQLNGHTGTVSALAVLPDGRLASGSYDKTIRLWNPITGAEAARLVGHDNNINALALLTDGRLVSASADRTIRLWDLQSSSELTRLKVQTKKTSLAPGSDGLLAIGSASAVESLALLGDGRLASGIEDETIRLWNVNTGEETAQLKGHTGRVSALAVLPDGRLASASHDKTVRLWNLRSGDQLAQLQGHSRWVSALAVLVDGRLVSGDDSGSIFLWDVRAGTVSKRLEGHAGVVRALVVFPDGRLASGSGDETIRLWDMNLGAETKRFTCNGWVTALAVLRDGRLASGMGDHTIRVWDPRSGTEFTRLVGHESSVTALTVLPDGQLVSGANDGTINLWDTYAGTKTSRLEGPAHPVSALAPLPDGRLTSGSGDNTIRLWDPRTGSELARLEVDAAVTGLAVLPASDGCGMRVVAGDQMGRLHWLEVLD